MVDPTGEVSRAPDSVTFVLATRNDHKLREFREAMPGFRIDPLPPEVELPPETGETFVDNALVKARAAFAATGRLSLADDSGIEAAALSGRPGVRSARFAGEGASDEENLAKLLGALAGQEDRSVAYVCALVLVGPEGRELLAEGRCEGTLTDHPRGSGGFGYDPAFVPHEGPGDLTMAELSPALKHSISHRGLAVGDLLRQLGKGSG